MTRRSLAPPAIWAILILTLSSIPNVPSLGPSGTDKLAHFVLYFVLGALCAPLVIEAEGRSFRGLAVLAAMLLFASLDEAHQLLVRGRDASLADWMADLLGAGLGLSLAAIVNSKKRATR